MMNATLANLARHHRRPAARRRGSVLVVVLALLSALMLLGFLFYTSASQERANARYFAASEKFYSTSLDADTLFNFALEQVIVGPDDDLVNSALWGGRYSLLANLVGTNIVPFNGPGVNVVDFGQFNTGVADGIPGVNQDYDATLNEVDTDGDGVDDRMVLNLADWATTTNETILPQYGPTTGTFPEPDANYTYPDINSVFLAYIGNEPLTGRKVIIPSFHRPQYLRGIGGVPELKNWYTNAALMPYTLRPHQARKIKYYDPATRTITASTLDRFLPTFWETTAPASGTDPNPTQLNTLLAEGDWNQVWVTDTSPTPPVPPQISQHDIDANDDGDKEAILLDLDHPAEATADGSAHFIPMYGITIFDLDALFNLNAHGNIYGSPELLTTNPFQSPDPTSPFISQSNEGRHRHEINPLPGLTTVPTGGITAEHQAFFGHVPASVTELANMELWFVLAGRVDKDASMAITAKYEGRWGNDLNRFEKANTAGSASIFDYPLPGVSGQDDDRRVADGGRGLDHRSQGGVFPTVLPSNPALPFTFAASRHPEDHQGQGSYVGIDGKTLNLVALTGALGARIAVPAYLDYWVPQTNAGPLWAVAQFVTTPSLTPAIITNAAYGLRSVAAYGALTGYLIDNPGETILNPQTARSQSGDSIFGVEETSAIHMSDNDYDESGILSRLLELVPANFAEPEVRKRYTSISRDLKAYGNCVGKRWLGPPVDNRAWEIGLAKAAGGTDRTSIDVFEWNVFPPYVDGTQNEDAGNQNRNIYGFRPEARGILQQQGVLVARNGRELDREWVKGLIRKLGVNHVAAQAPLTGDGRPEFLLRPVTPHPTTAVQRDEIPAPTMVDTAGVPLTPAASGDLPGTAGVRAHFGMPDSWVIASEIPTWNMSNPSLDRVGKNIVDEAGVAWPAALQEWHARRDRQNMARDIYTLLYVFGHVEAAFNPMEQDPRQSATAKYTNNQMREMAQFAVNVVDAMDPDDTITLFVYDKNLSDGYTLLDSGYGTLPDGTTPAAPTYNPAAATLTESGDVPAGTWEDDERGMVFGVEAQQLAFSEVLAVIAKKYGAAGPTDYDATLWDDKAHRDYTFVELQNMTPGRIPMMGGWSIVCQPVADPGFATPLTHTMLPRSLTILGDGDPLFDVAGSVVAEPGTTFTVGTAGDAHLNENPPPTYLPPNGTYYDSHLLVDLQGDATTGPPDFAGFEKIAPAAGGLDFDPLNAADTELNVNDFLVNEPWSDGAEIANDVSEPGTTLPPPKGGAWLHLGTQAERDDIVKDSVYVIFRLRRRVNLHREVPEQNSDPADEKRQLDNPWVEVDVCRVDLQVLDLNGSDVQTVLQEEIVSTKRDEPLSRLALCRLPDGSIVPNIYETANVADPDAVRNISSYQTNSLGGYHPTDLSDVAQIWQRHYDRAFASLADVLQVPLYSPMDLTNAISSDPATAYVAAVADQTAVAMARFLFPDGIPDPRKVWDPVALATVEVRPAGNLWYRALEFLEVPEKYGNPDGWPWFVDFGGVVPWDVPNEQQDLLTRRFGKINLNTLRHPHVLGGLLDDPRVMTPAFNPSAASYLPSANGETAGGGPRDWWTTMLASRDGGIDQFSIPFGWNVILPGTPAANPFKGFSVAPVGTGATPPTDVQIHETFEQTFLRSLYGDDTTGGFAATDARRRSLFALGNYGGPNDLGSTADLATRYRLLGKVLKHGTTRSNSYVIFMTCDFYEAEPQFVAGQTLYQIGPKMPADAAKPEEPRYRGVFVVDRTLALEMLKKSDLPPIQASKVYPQGSQLRTFSFARDPATGEPEFDWRKLVIDRHIVKEQ